MLNNKRQRENQKESSEDKEFNEYIIKPSFNLDSLGGIDEIKQESQIEINVEIK